jgi:hypothetical protein
MVNPIQVLPVTVLACSAIVLLLGGGAYRADVAMSGGKKSA